MLICGPSPLRLPRGAQKNGGWIRSRAAARWPAAVKKPNRRSLQTDLPQIGRLNRRAPCEGLFDPFTYPRQQQKKRRLKALQFPRQGRKDFNRRFLISFFLGRLLARQVLSSP
jgi:hypothetical protein